jgi:hypothetical protein
MCVNTTLRTLLLGGNKLGHDAGHCLADFISRNRSLVKLSLVKNYLSPESGRYLVNAYAHNPQLMELALSRDEIGEVQYQRLTEEYHTKRAMCASQQESGAVYTDSTGDGGAGGGGGEGSADGGLFDTHLTVEDHADVFTEYYQSS